MSEDSVGNGLRFGWGKWFLEAHGPTVIFTLGVCLLLATNFYLNNERKSEHMALVKGLDRIAASHDFMTCVYLLKPDELERLRVNYHPGAEAIPCPWLRREQP